MEEDLAQSVNRHSCCDFIGYAAIKFQPPKRKNGHPDAMQGGPDQAQCCLPKQEHQNAIETGLIA